MSNKQKTFKEKLIDLIYEELLNNEAAEGTRRILRGTLMTQLHSDVPNDVFDSIYNKHVREAATLLAERGVKVDKQGFPISTISDKFISTELEEVPRDLLQAPLTIVPASWNRDTKDLSLYIKENFEAFKDSEYLIWSDNLTSVFSLDSIKKTFIIFSNDQPDSTTTPFVVTFHTGNPNEGITGISMESLLAIVKNRLEYYNTTEFTCKENEIAVECCAAAIEALHNRYRKRLDSGKLGIKEL